MQHRDRYGSIYWTQSTMLMTQPSPTIYKLSKPDPGPMDGLNPCPSRVQHQGRNFCPIIGGLLVEVLKADPTP